MTHGELVVFLRAKVNSNVPAPPCDPWSEAARPLETHLTVPAAVLEVVLGTELVLALEVLVDPDARTEVEVASDFFEDDPDEHEESASAVTGSNNPTAAFTAACAERRAERLGALIQIPPAGSVPPFRRVSSPADLSPQRLMTHRLMTRRLITQRLVTQRLVTQRLVTQRRSMT